MPRITMGLNGSLQLQEPEASFFDEGEPIEVAQYRWHLALRKEWQRVRPRSAATERQRVRARAAFDSAATRFKARAGDVYSSGDAETGLYLMGYAIECRLKVLICDQHGTSSLLRAQYEAEKLRGEELDIMGGRGHDLELLLDLAGLQYLKGEEEFRERWVYYVSRWDVGWRYKVPNEVLEPRSRNDYYEAFLAVWQRLEESA